VDTLVSRQRSTSDASSRLGQRAYGPIPVETRLRARASQTLNEHWRVRSLGWKFPLKTNSRSPALPKVNVVRMTVPPQPVDATPSNALIRHCFPGRSALFGCPRSNIKPTLRLKGEGAWCYSAQISIVCCGDVTANVAQIKAVRTEIRSGQAAVWKTAPMLVELPWLEADADAARRPGNGSQNYPSK